MERQAGGRDGERPGPTCPTSLELALSLLWKHVSNVYAGNGPSTSPHPHTQGVTMPVAFFPAQFSLSWFCFCSNVLPSNIWERLRVSCAQKTVGLEPDSPCPCSLLATCWLRDPRQATEPPTELEGAGGRGEP